MKTPLILLTVLILCLSEGQFFAQTQTRELINLDLIIKKENYLKNLKVPISKNPFLDEKSKVFNEGEFITKGWAITGCSNCILSSDVAITAHAVPLNDNLSRVNISLSFHNKKRCDTENKSFLIERGKNSELNLRCSVKVKAYYPKETK